MLRVPLGMGDEASRLLDGNQTFIAREETRKPETTLYRVQAGDTLTAIAQKLGMSVKALQQTNKIASPGQLQRGQMLQVREISAAQSRPYQVRHGDTLTAIAKRFGVSLGAILEANEVEGHRIYPGQILLLPRL
jgi:LysM repeat protein